MHLSFPPSPSCKRANPNPKDSFYLFFSLPEEMSLHILSFLSAQDICMISRTSHALRGFANENIIWRKLCKKQGWVVPRSLVTETPFFDFQQYYSEKHTLLKPGTLKWGERVKTHGTPPTKRFKHTSTVVGKYMIMIGGQETDTKRFDEVVYFDSETKTFSQPTIRGDKVPQVLSPLSLSDWKSHLLVRWIRWVWPEL